MIFACTSPYPLPCRLSGRVIRCCPLANSHGLERCESGRIGVPGEHVNWQRFRGFESHPLRHTKLARHGACSMVLGDGIKTIVM